MKKGRIIFLNGVTSAGKTSIAKCIQKISTEHIYHLSNDMFHQLEWDMVDMERVKGCDGEKYMAESIVLMYNTASMLAAQGTDIVIDGMLYEIDGFAEKYGKSHYGIMREILAGCNLLMVDVYCPLEVCRQRNIARGDRREYQSHDQDRAMNKDILYDVSVDTSIHSAEICARKILLVAIDSLDLQSDAPQQTAPNPTNYHTNL
ncbi:MAG: chloramphenicol phosphotransferase CPT family protein [Dehalococcoidia bacterium]|nr:chloramphenicol phosphotransferase CPT family protein [Dehalococcoidia bacterium]